MKKYEYPLTLDNWARIQVNQKRYISKKKNIEFDLSIEDISIPEFCPILGLKLQINNPKSPKDNSPSIDRINPSKGYTKDNIAVISNKANRIKNDASLEEIEKVYLWLKKNWTH